MARRLAGMAILALLTGCPMQGLVTPQNTADKGADATLVSPSLQHRIEVTEVHGLDSRIPVNLAYLLQASDLPATSYKLELDEFQDSEAEAMNRVFPDYRSAIAYAERKGSTQFLPSADVVSAMSKQINDGIYARFETALEQGEGGFPAKKAWIKQLLDAALKDTSSPTKRDLAARLAGGLKLSGEPVSLPADVQQRMQEGLDEFQADPMRSKPIGFFTWNQTLKTVFTRDRWLQGWFGEGQRAWIVNGGYDYPENLEAGVQAESLIGDAVKPGYTKTLDFYHWMTNKFSGYSPLDLEQLLPPGKTMADAQTDAAVRAQMMAKAKTRTDGPWLAYWAFLPPSTSPESELFAKLEGLGKLPPGADRMQALIDSIRSGRISLAPGPDTGFYTYQQHALEALLKVASLPEAQRVTYGEKYQKRLEEAFKAGLAKARETHAKQLDVPVAAGAAPILKPPSGPPWVVEPLPTYYERQAAGYRFLKEKVVPLFDPAFIQDAKTLRDGGNAGTQSLAEALDQGERLMTGLAELAKAEIGLAAVKDTSAANVAADWIRALGKDERLALDTRVAVPVNRYLDAKNREFAQYWGTAGVTLNRVHVEGNGGATYLIVSDKFIFFDRPVEAGPLNREEYRAILDGSATLDEAKRKLQGS